MHSQQAQVTQYWLAVHVQVIDWEILHSSRAGTWPRSAGSRGFGRAIRIGSLQCSLPHVWKVLFVLRQCHALPLVQREVGVNGLRGPRQYQIYGRVDASAARPFASPARGIRTVADWPPKTSAEGRS